MYVCTYVYVYVYMYIYIYACVCVFTCECVYTYIYIHMHMCSCIYIHIYHVTCIHICTCRHVNQTTYIMLKINLFWRPQESVSANAPAGNAAGASSRRAMSRKQLEGLGFRVFKFSG